MFLILLFITISRATLCNLQTERYCLYESLNLFSVYQDMVCMPNKYVPAINFSSSCERFCTVHINKCGDKNNKKLGVELTISSSNISIESISREEIALITCNFSTLTDPENYIGDCKIYSTTQMEVTQETRTTQPSLRTNSASCVGNLIGAVIGGALVGATVTAIISVFLYRKSSIFQKSKPKFDVIPNPVYRPDDEPLEENPQHIDRKIVVYNEVNDDIQNAVKVQPVQQQRNLSDTNVYNRLNESDQEDRSEYYDHAEPTPSSSLTEDGYGSLFVEQDVNDNYSEVDRAAYHEYGNKMTVGSKQNNNYSTLEANK